MSESTVVTIYGQDLFPDLPCRSRAAADWFTQLRRWSFGRRLYVFGNNRDSYLPPRLNSFKQAWNRYIFNDPHNYIVIPYPNTFSEIKEVLDCHDYRFQYTNPAGDTGFNLRDMPENRGSSSVYSYEVRYCIILAAFNTVFYLKNMVMRNTRLFSKIDFIVPVQSGSAAFEMDRPNIQIPLSQQYLKKNLLLNLNIYRELDDLVCRNVQDDFWTKVIYIADGISLSMLQTVADRMRIRRPNPDLAYRRIEQEMVGENLELKQEIIALLGANEVDEKIMSAIYDLVLQAGLQQPSF